MKYVKKMAGEKCYLSPISIEDAELYYEWINDLEVTQFLHAFNNNYTLETEREILGSVSRKHVYGIVDCKTDTLIGNCGLVDLDSHNRTANTGIFIGRKEFQGKGYGTEALTLLVDYGFNYLNLQNIMLDVYEDNPRALSCYKKVGFKTIGVRREARTIRRQTFDVIIMDITPSDLYSESGS